jgi:hypothetical protein
MRFLWLSSFRCFGRKREGFGLELDFFCPKLKCRLLLVYKLSGQLINEEKNENDRFREYFSTPGHWNLKSSHRMLLRAAHSFVQNKAALKQIQEWRETYLKDNTWYFYYNWSVSLEFLGSGTELMCEFLQWAQHEDWKKQRDKLKTCFTWWKKAYSEWRRQDAAADTDQHQWTHRFDQWLPSYGKRPVYEDEDAPSQALQKKPAAKNKKQREEDEAADEAERWKEYDPEEEEAKTAKLRKQKAQSAKPKEAIPDPPQQREPTSM